MRLTEREMIFVEFLNGLPPEEKKKAETMLGKLKALEMVAFKSKCRAAANSLVISIVASIFFYFYQSKTFNLGVINQLLLMAGFEISSVFVLWALLYYAHKMHCRLKQPEAVNSFRELLNKNNELAEHLKTLGRLDPILKKIITNYKLINGENQISA